MHSFTCICRTRFSVSAAICYAQIVATSFMRVMFMSNETQISADVEIDTIDDEMTKRFVVDYLRAVGRRGATLFAQRVYQYTGHDLNRRTIEKWLQRKDGPLESYNRRIVLMMITTPHFLSVVPHALDTMRHHEKTIRIGKAFLNIYGAPGSDQGQIISHLRCLDGYWGQSARGDNTSYISVQSVDRQPFSIIHIASLSSASSSGFVYWKNSENDAIDETSGTTFVGIAWRNTDNRMTDFELSLRSPNLDVLGALNTSEFGLESLGQALPHVSYTHLKSVDDEMKLLFDSLSRNMLRDIPS